MLGWAPGQQRVCLRLLTLIERTMDNTLERKYSERRCGVGGQVWWYVSVQKPHYIIVGAQLHEFQ